MSRFTRCSRPLDNPIFPEPDFTKEDNIALDMIMLGQARINKR